MVAFSVSFTHPIRTAGILVVTGWIFSAAAVFSRLHPSLLEERGANLVPAIYCKLQFYFDPCQQVPSVKYQHHTPNSEDY